MERRNRQNRGHGRSNSAVADADSDLSKGSNKQNRGDIKIDLVIDMKDGLNKVSKLSSNCCIYKVPKVLRKIDQEAYNPQVISIGPFHRGRKKLIPMEEHKWRYLYDFLKKDPKNDIEYYVHNMRSIEEKVRRCYAELIDLDGYDFVRMMLLDGSFVIELILKYCLPDLRDIDDPIFETAWMLNAIRLDMALLENQLPFFVLEHLFNLINGPHQRYCQSSFLELAICFFQEDIVLGRIAFDKNVKGSDTKPGDALLGGNVSDRSSRDVFPAGVKVLRRSFGDIALDLKVSYKNFGEVKHFVHLLGKGHEPSEERVPPSDHAHLEFIPNATELKNAGVKFRKGKGVSFLDVQFSPRLLQGIFEIPPIKIDSGSNIIIRNIIAFEHFEQRPNYISQYITLMDSLIDTADDVALLRDHGIINNWLCDNEELAILFNKFRTGAMIEKKSFYYARLFEDVNIYYKSFWHKCQAKLMRNYLNSPWAALSVLAAVILLFCTVVQTVFTVFYK